MARATWQGFIALGQLGIPVRLYTALQSIRPRFVQLHETDGSPVERQLRCRAEEREIASTEVIRAVEYEPGHYLTLTDRELAHTAQNPVKSIAVQQFCAPELIAPRFFDKPYFVVPTKGGERAYALLREVLVRRNVVAIVRFIIYNREYLAVIAVQGDLLMLQQLRFATELVPREQIKSPPLPKPSPHEIEALSAVVDRFSGPFYIEDYHDEHAEHIQALIERKARGLPAPRPERTMPQATPEQDILAALRHTLGTTTPLPGSDAST